MKYSNKNWLLLSLSILAMLHALTLSAQVTLYDQSGGIQGDLGPSSQIFTDISSRALYAADDFEVPAGKSWSITQIQAFGKKAAGDLGGSVTVNIFSADPTTGLPTDNIVYTQVITPTSAVTDPDIDLAIPSGNPLCLNEGKYWLNVLVSSNLAGRWYWDYNLTGYSNDYYLKDPTSFTGASGIGTSWTASTGIASYSFHSHMAFKLTGTSTNTPSITSTAGTAVNDNATYNYTVTTSDPDIDPVTVTATLKPTWLSFNGTLLTGSATGQAGDHNVTLKADDGNGGKVTQSFTITVTDVTPPAFENSTPSAASIAATSFTLNTDINEAGKIYYVAVADGATAPTAAEVKLGKGSGGTGQVASGNAAVTAGGFTNAFSVTGLTAATAYDVYVIAEDDEGTPNIQASTTKIDASTAYPTPQEVDFTGFTGSNLSTVFPGWAEGSGDPKPLGTTSQWAVSSSTQTTTLGKTTAKINLYTTNRKDWLVSPPIAITATDVLKYKVAVTNFNSATTDTMGADDFVKVMVSADNGNTWTMVKEFTVADALSNSLTEQSMPLSAYAGQTIQVAFYAKDGPIDNTEDYDFHVTDIFIGVLDTTPPVFENSTPSTASIATTSFTLNTDIDEAGKIYYVVVADGATAPTSAEVKAGTGSAGTGQVTSGNTAVSTGGFTHAFSVTSLAANTAYDVYTVAEDDKSSPNLQTSPTKIDVTTINTAPTFTSTAVTSVGDNATYSYAVTTSDTDGDHVTVTTTVKPSWLSLSSSALTSSFAGDGTSGVVDGPVASARFSGGKGMVFDADGNLYLVEEGSSVLRKITPAGVVSTVAGDGTQGYLDGIGTAAKFYFPEGIDIGPDGMIYISELSNSRVRKYNPTTGEVTSITGNGTHGYADGDASTAQFNSMYDVAVDDNNNIYVADARNHRVRKINTTTSQVSTLAGSGVAGFADGIGAAAQFNFPITVEIGPDGYLYVGENQNHRIRKINLTTGEVTTFAGSGVAGSTNGTGTAAQLTSPFEMTFDKAGNLYFIEEGKKSIRKITPTGVVSTHAGSQTESGYVEGEGTQSRFANLYAIATSPSGDLYVNDLSNYRIRKIQNLTTLSGDATGEVGDHNVTLKADDGNGGIVTQAFIITVNDATAPVFENSTPSSASIAAKSFTLNSDINEAGKIYYVVLADGATAPTSAEVKAGTGNGSSGQITSGNAAVSTGGFTHAFSVTGLVSGTAYDVYVAAEDDEGTPNLQASPTKVEVTTINTAPTFTSTAVTSVKADNAYSYEVTASDPDGDALNITTPTLPSWLALTSSATVSTVAGDGTADFANGTGVAAKFNQPYGVAVDKSGNVYIGDLQNHRIRKITPAGIVTTLAGSGIGGNTDGTGAAAQFRSPRGIDIDESGNVYVADQGNHRIRKITPAGVVTTLAGSTQGYTDDTGTAAQFHSPTEVAVDNSGNVYVADNGNHRIRKITPAGVVSTLAGSGVAGFAEGTGTAAQFDQPFGIAVDGSGNIYVADRLNHRIRKITPAGVVSTLAGSGVSGFADGMGIAAQLSSPFGLDADNFGNIYVADFSNRRIRKVSPTGVVTTVAGSGGSGHVDGAGTTSQFNFPTGVSVDASNNVYVADYSNHRVRKIAQKFVLEGSPAETAVGDHPVVLQVSDGKGGTAQQSFTITVVESTPPVFTSATSMDFAENGAGTAYTVTATDDNTITYSLGSGNDEALFDFDAASGVLTFKAAPDFENPNDVGTNNTYVVNVIATDVAENKSNQDVTITVTDVDEIAPVFTSTSTADFAENGTGSAYAAAATDANTLTYSFGSGNDEALFDIVSGTGVVTFKTSPDFESPTDGDANNTYVIIVIASDGTNSTNQNVTITVTNVDDAGPVFTSTNSVDFEENGTGTAYTAVATDANTLTYSLGSGNDEALFDIVSATGVVTFNTSPDFENPADSDANNTYVILVIASDGTNDTSQEVTITVIDVNDTPETVSITIPTAITPNGDGINDTWELLDIGLFPNSKVAVFDRNGSIVFNSTGYATPWKGTDNGKELAVGTYYYSVDLTSDGGETYDGFVMILK